MWKAIALTLVLLLACTLVYATPSPATWVRKIFIGYDENFYYCLSIERNQPGSYFKYNDHVFFCKYKNNGTITKKILLRETHHQDTTPLGIGSWTHKEKIKSPFELETYLIENHIFYAFPSDNLRSYNIVFDEDGMTLKKEKNKILLIGSNELNKYIKGYVKNMKVVEYYESKNYFYFVVKYGLGCYDADFCQAIVPINLSIIREAEKAFWKNK
ncbi:MAG: hypothetical protein QMD92_07875 [bacterium]|nr:hypothetical protein [bacterium]